LSAGAAPALPRWADLGLLHALNLLMALAVGAAVVALVGFSPTQALALLAKGAFGSQLGLSYTLYYATARP
jgi:simple sugar transport system permease protein